MTIILGLAILFVMMTTSSGKVFWSCFGLLAIMGIFL